MVSGPLLLVNRSMKGLTDIPGIRVGHVSDYEAITGCTAILARAARWPASISVARRPAPRKLMS